MSEITPETRLWNLLRGTMTTKALGIAADLRVADALGDAPRQVVEVAQEVGADPTTLHRILRALASDGVFAEDRPGVFSNTEASALLRGESWREFAHLFGSVFAEAVNTLDPRVGDETFSKQFGTDFWSWLQANPDERRSFDGAMAGGKERTAERLAQLDWRQDETVVDVGGGNGALLRELFRRRPELCGIVFDLPETVRDETNLGDRIEFVAGSFFESVPPGDAYVLSGILHDWSDERAGAILCTIHASAAQGARLLLIESVVQAGNEPQGSKWLDLLMLVLAGGRERTAEDWRQLMHEAGFAVESIEDGLIQGVCR
jgi:O-methyltransferase domain/Dimerisation domain